MDDKISIPRECAWAAIIALRQLETWESCGKTNWYWALVIDTELHRSAPIAEAEEESNGQ